MQAAASPVHGGGSGGSEDDLALVPKPVPSASPESSVTPTSDVDPADVSGAHVKRLSAPRRAVRRAGCWLAKKPVTIVYLIVACNGIALSAPAIFLPRMLIKLYGYTDTSVGTPAGALSAAFSLGMFTSSFYMGHLSDLYGRKPLLLLGVGVAACLLSVFSLSPSFAWAVVNRATEGLLNAIIPVSKAYLSDYYPHGADRTLAFAYFGACFSLARAISSAVAGFAYELAPKNTPWEFATPCLVSAAPLVVIFLIALRWLPAVPKPFNSGAGSDSGSDSDEESGGDHVELVPLRASRAADAAAEAKAAAPRTPTTPAPHKLSLWQKMKAVLREPNTRLLIFLYSVNSFGNGSILVGFVLFLNLPVQDAGIGLSPGAVGILLFLFGIVAAVFQFCCFKRISARFRPLTIYRAIGTVMLGMGTLLLPVAALPLRLSCYRVGTQDDQGVLGEAVTCDPSMGARVLSAAILVVAVAGLAIGFMTCLPLVHVMLANVAKSNEAGLTQGLAQSAAALLRGIGPFTSGVMFATFAHDGDPFWLFGVLGGCYFLSFLLSLGLDRAVVE